jgi:hypothetical protein
MQGIEEIAIGNAGVISAGLQTASWNVSNT